jgi:acylphosphatase
MMRFTAYVSGRIQRVGYRARIVDLARKMGLSGLVQNRPDGQVLVIAEGEKQTLEKFAAALQIKNTFIEVKGISLEYSPGSGGFSDFRKITGPDEVGERLDDGIEILKEMVTSLNSLNGKMDQSLNKQDQMLGKQDQMLGKQDQMLGKQDQMLGKQDQMLGKQDQMLDKQDQMLDKQDDTITEIRGLRGDLKTHMDMRFERIEADLAELKEMKTALKEKGII